MEMTEEQITLLMLKGAISEQAPEEQRTIKAAADQIRAVVDASGPLGVLALGLVGAELAAAG